MLEILGGVRQPLQYRSDVFSPGFVLHIRIGDLLGSQSGSGLIAQMGAAEGAGAVGREDAEIIRKLAQFLGPGVVALGSQGSGGGRASHEIGTAHAADKKYISGEDEIGLIRLLFRGHYTAKAIWGVARGLQNFDQGIPHLDFGAFFQGLVGELVAALGAGVDGTADGLGQL